MAGNFFKSSGLAALAAGLALAALPASAQEQGRGRWNGGAEASAQRGAGNWRGPAAGWRNNGTERSQAQQTQPRAERAPPAWRAQQRAQGDGAPRQGWSGQRGVDGQSRWSGQRRAPDSAQAPVARQTEPRTSTWQRNRAYTDAQRNRSYRNDDRDRDRNRDRNWQGRRDNDRSAWRGSGSNWRGGNDWRDNRYGYNQNARRWDRDWRRDNRYDWSGYRSGNRNIYRIGRYNAPYRNYGYRRLSIGFGLDSMFFGSRYWINDPWQYRLPSAYGPYRWVRYFDDVLLVDTYTGEVVDVVYDFFW